MLPKEQQYVNQYHFFAFQNTHTVEIKQKKEIKNIIFMMQQLIIFGGSLESP